MREAIFCSGRRFLPFGLLSANGALHFSMTVSDFQIRTVIRAYVRNMRLRAENAMDEPAEDLPEDLVTISEGALRRRFFGRIGERVAKRARGHEHD